MDVALHRPLTFVRAGTDNPLDNERAEINGDGVQLHVVPDGGTDAGSPVAGWLLVPDVGDTVRVVPTTPPAGELPLRASWAATDVGYRVVATLPTAGLAPESRTIALDVLVNEMPPGRERRRGQLVLSGADGGFVYLQGDRHDAARCLPVVLPLPAAL